ncbi:hypothetical protein Psal006b_02731 [Piscirickettsia salmonis]|uniref:SpoVR family protein n=1 Tax=Piscirickettsia salmonis TaxID=1238 RepID=A0AAC8VFL3_PISSA|nr:SpoVR family protein [Piscirickettsia salmonis]ALT18133.1 hypothetical protein PSLF89_04065 [Piscirickettsia salmonis LF-89 = ATCC VR-1361]ALY01868.1 hypothetical protein AWE47_02450 [Piscirickettsia salmonis]AMA41378.1 hypothetical protein AWJ11_02435 [Piscirickettsia salmonis]AOS36580.1 hypothetical protein AVM72_15425 [Piscirickettsia salmonis]
MFSKSCQCVSPGTNANPDYKFPLGQAALVELNSMAAQLHSENYSAAEVELTAYQGVLPHIEP